jgi:hypothetical protein
MQVGIIPRRGTNDPEVVVPENRRCVPQVPRLIKANNDIQSPT